MAKRNITGSGTIKAPEPPKSEERQFAEAIQYMVEQMSKRFRNQVFEELNQSTIKKFEDAPTVVGGVTFTDAQVGNFARVFLKLADKVRRKLMRQFDDDRLEKLAKRYTGKVNKRNAKEFYRRVEKQIGISSQELEATEGLTFQINAYQLETFQWVRKMRDDTMQQWTSQTLRDMAEGKNLETIMSQFDGMVEKRKNHAKMVARTQISTFNSLTSKIRAQNLGIEKAVWRTSKDERVRGRPGGKYPNARPSHWDLEGKEFDLSKGLEVNGQFLLPGTPPNCRCDYEMVIPDADTEDAS